MAQWIDGWINGSMGECRGGWIMQGWMGECWGIWMGGGRDELVQLLANPPFKLRRLTQDPKLNPSDDVMKCLMS